MQSTKAPASMMMTSIARGEHLPLYPARLKSFACVDLTPSGLLFPSGMRKLIEQLGDLARPLDKVLAGNSLLPLFHRALVPEEQATLESHFLDAPKLGLPALVGLNGPRSGWARATVARCPGCIQEDIAPCGNPFWRRDHLVPGLLFCGRHRLPLHIPCEKCADFRRHPNLTTHAGRHCGCGLRPLPQTTTLSNAEVASEIEMAKAASKLLQPNYFPNLNHIGIATLVAKSARALRLVEDSGVNWRRADAHFKDVPHARLISRTSLLLGRPHVSTVLRGKGVFRNPLHNVVLLMALYGTWDAIEAECLLLDAEERPTAPAPNEPNESPQKKGQQYRSKWVAKNHDRWFAHYVEMYREVRKKHIDDSFSQLMRRLPHSALLFVTHAKLLAIGEDVPAPQFAHAGTYDRSLDRSFSRHIRATAKRLLKEDYQGRLTQRALTRGHRMDIAWHQIRDRLPRAKQVLAACQESLSAYQRRRLLMLSKSGAVFGMPGLTKEQIDEMDDAAVREHLKQGVAR